MRSDYGNAERLVAQHGDRLRYCHPFKRWYCWDGQRWRPDDSGGPTRAAKLTVRSIYAEAAQLEDDQERRATTAWAVKSEAASRIRAMLDLAASETAVVVLPDELDRDPWALNAHNGTVDLRTGRLRPHDPDDLITKLAPVAYDPDAPAPVWLKFLDRVLDHDQELIGFVQRMVGYFLTGSVDEKAFFVIAGPSDAGKTKFTEAIHDLLGEDYARTMKDDDLLQLRRAGGGNNDGIADLHGARFATLSETPGGARLNVSLVKHLTGTGRVKAMRKYEHPFAFRPTAKFVLDTNHRPRITDTDDAIWNRVKLLPFDVVIPKPEQDKQLGEKLKAERAGILAWAVRGCLAWQQEGLDPPAKVAAATEEYRREENDLGGFLDACCEQVPGAYAYSEDLHTAYVEYTGDRISQKALGAMLREHGFDRARMGHGRRWAWVGLRLTSTNTASADP